MTDILTKIIRESIEKVLCEADIVPNDAQGNANIVKNPSINAWRMIYNLMDNVKTKMDYDWEAKNGRMSAKDVDNVIDYILYSLRGITK